MRVIAMCLAASWTPIATGYVWDADMHTVPAFIVEYAPLIYLYSEERYYPGSIEEYVPHFCMSTGNYNHTSPLSLSNLTAVAAEIRSEHEDAELYLTSLSQWEPEPGPPWLTGFESMRPNLYTGKIERAVATLIVMDKPDIDSIDAFWFYFYPFNLGPFVMGHGPFGNHIGDWEHTLVRFNRKTHEPKLLWMSAHGGGTAYNYDALLEEDALDGRRPVIFSARGTHAHYSSPGRHPHDIPWHMLSDFTDRGDLWDPTLNFVAYNVVNGEVVHPANGSVAGREQEFGDWLMFDGHWGNKQLNKTDPRQQWSAFEFKLIDGPLGPLAKNLHRRIPCERFKWWNFAKLCRTRQRATAGEGNEADVVGCEAFLKHIPSVLRPPIELMTMNGYFCFWLDRLFS